MGPDSRRAPSEIIWPVKRAHCEARNDSWGLTLHHLFLSSVQRLYWSVAVLRCSLPEGYSEEAKSSCFGARNYVCKSHVVIPATRRFQQYVKIEPLNEWDSLKFLGGSIYLWSLSQIWWNVTYLNILNCKSIPPNQLYAKQFSGFESSK